MTFSACLRVLLVATLLPVVAACARDLPGDDWLHPAPLLSASPGGEPMPVANAMPTGQRIVPPIGYIGYCLRHAEDCGGGTDAPADVDLTPARWFTLVAVNDEVNRLPEITDIANYEKPEYWTLPNARGGDCEDMALLKRKRLIERGWPADALLLATTLDTDGAGHAVLLVAAQGGELVLDNKTSAILPWRMTPYRWKARQSRERPYAWVDLDPSTFRAVTEAHLPPPGAPPPFIVAALKLKARNATTGTLASAPR